MLTCFCEFRLSYVIAGLRLAVFSAVGYTFSLRYDYIVSIWGLDPNAYLVTFWSYSPEVFGDCRIFSVYFFLPFLPNGASFRCLLIISSIDSIL